jgi:Fur family peroxide stress response transcriptional regulator
MPKLESFTSALKEAGLRLTPQRIAICKLLSESREHPTAARIHQALEAEYPSLSLMTVYNTLNTLVDLGVVNALGHAADGNVHYDGDTSPHINLACVSCHRIVDFPSPGLTDLDAEVSTTSGYKLLGARLVYYGLCPNCQGSVIH